MDSQHPTDRRSALGFLGKAVLLMLLLFLPLFVAGEAFRALYPWQAVQNPRERILWDTFDGHQQIVLLGDSEFYSCQVDRPEELLWTKLGQYTGKTVFPGALSGAMPVDFLNAARRVARTGGDAVVFVNLIPTRFLRFSEVDTGVVVFPQLRRPQPTPTFEGMEAFLEYTLSQTFFFSQNPTALQKSLKHRTPDSYFRRGSSRNFIWWEQRSYSEGSFLRLRKKVDRLDGLPPTSDFHLVEDLHTILARGGFRPVFVLTPLSREVIDAYSTGDYAARLSAFLDTTHTRLTDYLDEQGLEYIDLTHSAPSEAFADLVHTNTLGDDLMARAMADWLAGHPR